MPAMPEFENNATAYWEMKKKNMAVLVKPWTLQYAQNQLIVITQYILQILS